ncbi:phage tail fiber protein [Aliamphritea hakodatensis]|uniref:phage tail fiber protein n=1 Tax=Aliamphritea hakodatensis TaxID=2895352 RepID=UPI0022FD8ACA|nr:hypothetical protein [Aliamphritea hakodatensis]
MNALTNEGEALVLNLFRGVDIPAGTKVELVAYTAVSTDDDGVSQSVEVSDTGYSRKAVTFNDPEAGTAGRRKCVSNVDVEFGPFDTTGGQITSYGIAVDDVVVIRGLATTPKDIVKGGVIKVKAGELYPSLRGASDSFLDAVLNYVCKGHAVTAPESVHAGLFSDAGELADPGCSRLPVVFNAPQPDQDSSALTISNQQGGSWVATEDWPLVNRGKLFDQAGNELAVLVFPVEMNLTNYAAGDELILAAGLIVIKVG